MKIINAIATALIIILISAAFVLYFVNNDRSPILGVEDAVDSDSGSPDDMGQTRVSYSGKEYLVYWHKVPSEKISLHANFEEKSTARNFFEDNECLLLTNSGFYIADSGEEARPTGLFIFDREQISGFRVNATHNGIFSINEMGVARITRQIPSGSMVHAVQTGPILMENGSAIDFNMLRDKNARRVVAAITGSNEVVFMIVHSPESSFGGPLLSDLPEILILIESQHNLGLADAVNLDGGAASAFYSENIYFSEISPVGAFFCVR